MFLMDLLGLGGLINYLFEKKVLIGNNGFSWLTYVQYYLENKPSGLNLEKKPISKRRHPPREIVKVISKTRPSQKNFRGSMGFFSILLVLVEKNNRETETDSGSQFSSFNTTGSQSFRWWLHGVPYLANTQNLLVTLVY